MRLTIFLLSSVALYASDFLHALRDPLSYGPPAVVGLAGYLDWSSSQRYFEQGWVEANARYTQSGKRNAKPIDAAAGYRRIALREVLPALGISVGVNTFSYWLERRTCTWVGRVLRWSAATILISGTVPSFRQWRRNRNGTP